MPRAIRPYIERPLHDLLYVARILRQRDMALPTDLEAALAANGVDAATV